VTLGSRLFALTTVEEVDTRAFWAFYVAASIPNYFLPDLE